MTTEEKSSSCSAMFHRHDPLLAVVMLAYKDGRSPDWVAYHNGRQREIQQEVQTKTELYHAALKERARAHEIDARRVELEDCKRQARCNKISLRECIHWKQHGCNSPGYQYPPPEDDDGGELTSCGSSSRSGGAGEGNTAARASSPKEEGAKCQAQSCSASTSTACGGSSSSSSTSTGSSSSTRSAAVAQSIRGLLFR